ncbi:2-methylcitrate dehydratase PrpD [Lentzea fradiae]|uniref:2-methylcitrate dehydratase PrpD n=1 Tax=Lentzea fradiae TaxID=200378 RepID=A0A1G7KDC6_9PSEU|nr:MmgE/PrpD family protein [Lentzea fradiae]SDF35308.1 2-methylcitrate dehydratase PrpD [Lentzea fradiae]
MTELTLSQTVARFAVKTAAGELPEDVRASVRHRVLDVLGLCLGGRALDTSTAALAFVAEQGSAGRAHVIGDTTPVPAAQAAFANGVLAHSLDYDDTHLPSVLHPSASIVPAALAAAQDNGASGDLLLAAIAAGLEVCVRVGMAGYDPESGNSVFFEHGQHATSICGAVGSAVAAALLGGADEQEVAHAIGIVASLSSGIIEANRTGGTVKRLHCGWAAQAGVSAARLVRHGFTGPPTVFEGRFGFFQAFLHGEYRPEAITDGLGTDWEVPRIFFKPYPANHFTHTIVDAAAELRRQGLAPQDVASLEIGVPAPVVRTVGDPIEKKRTPSTPYEAQFSGPYAAVVGLFGGGGLGAALGDYAPEHLTDPARQELMRRTTVVADDECTAIFPHQFPAVVRATSADGRQWTAKALVNRGGVDNPLTDDEIARKFTDLAGPVLGEAAARDVVEAVAGLGTTTEVDDLLRLTAPRTNESTEETR